MINCVQQSVKPFVDAAQCIRKEIDRAGELKSHQLLDIADHRTACISMVEKDASRRRIWKSSKTEIATVNSSKYESESELPKQQISQCNSLVLNHVPHPIFPWRCIICSTERNMLVKLKMTVDSVKPFGCSWSERTVTGSSEGCFC